MSGRYGDGTSERDHRRRDVILALLVGLLTLAGLVGAIPILSVSHSAAQSITTPDPLGIELVLLGSLCLIWRRRAPVVVLTVSTSAFCAYLLLGYPAARPVAPVVALYTVVVATSSLVAAGISAALSLVLVAAYSSNHRWAQDEFDDQIIAHVAMVGAACMLGYAVQLGRARASVLLEQAVRLDREHVATTQELVRLEHARIARELHDIVAHHVSVITAQAGGAQRVFDRRPEQARAALGSIEATGRDALTEMRRLLGVLQPDERHTGRVPQPDLDMLPALIAQTRSAGLPVAFRVHGDRRPLPSGVELNAYRIVQEALTNTLKHAGPARVDVDLTYGSAGLDLAIRDDGRGLCERPNSGVGLIGMRQRAALLGGKIAAGPGVDGGFQVTATLPAQAGPR